MFCFFLEKWGYFVQAIPHSFKCGGGMYNTTPPPQFTPVTWVVYYCIMSSPEMLLIFMSQSHIHQITNSVATNCKFCTNPGSFSQ